MPITLLILSFAGFADAAYLTIEYLNNSIPPCTTSGCEIVLTSSYATLFSVPLSFFGLLYYTVLVGLLFWYVQYRNKKTLRLVFLVISVGLLFSAYLIYLQQFIIGAYCTYCLISASITTILWICTFLELRNSGTIRITS